jgi:hypothetical protein
VTVGAGSSVTCASGATCTVTCSGTCSAQNQGGAMTVKCAGDASPVSVATSRQC